MIRISDLLELMTIASLALGIAVREKHKNFELPYIIVFTGGFMVAGIFATVDLTTTGKSKAEKFEIVYTMNAASSVLSVFLVAKINRNLLAKLYRKIEEHYLAYEDFFDYAAELLSKVTPRFFCIVLFTCIPVIAIPLTMTLSDGVKRGNTKSLIFKSWYPWNSSSILGYSLTITVQLANLIFGYLLVTAIICCLLACMISLFSLVRIFEKMSRNSFETKSRNYERKNEEIRNLIRLHRIIMTFADDVVSYFSYSSVMMVSGVFTSAMFLISIFFEISGEYIYKIKLVSASLVVTEALFIYCYCGDLLHETNQRLKDIIYGIPWYDENINTKKTFLMILILTQKEFKLRAYKMSWIRLSFFMHLTRILYSAVQVLTKS